MNRSTFTAWLVTVVLVAITVNASAADRAPWGAFARA